MLEFFAAFGVVGLGLALIMGLMWVLEKCLWVNSLKEDYTKLREGSWDLRTKLGMLQGDMYATRDQIQKLRAEVAAATARLDMAYQSAAGLQGGRPGHPDVRERSVCGVGTESREQQNHKDPNP